MRCMTAALGLFVLVGIGASWLSAEETQFPYKAYVTADEVYVRSGPGRNYYPTDKLTKGAEVEVYRHDPGGWCAIRPPKGSFTWVSGRYLQPQKKDLGVITQQGVSARVGSAFSDIRDVIQVRLDKGEPVEILEAVQVGVGQSQIWYKISPPSGEFRWVSAKYIDPDYPHNGLRKTGAAGDAAKDAGGQNGSEDASTRDAVVPFGRLATGPRGISPQEYQAELDRCALTLSMMVVEEPTVWSFETLRPRVESLLDHAQTAVERGQARLLLSKIARFEDIKLRYQAVIAMREETEQSGRFFSSLRRTMREAREYVDTQSGEYDGQGVLQRVRSEKPGDPRYALLDERGRVRYYVSPAPGVNLHNYVGQPIGVTGTRGYLTDQKVQYIMARHVTPLEGGGTVVR